MTALRRFGGLCVGAMLCYATLWVALKKSIASPNLSPQPIDVPLHPQPPQTDNSRTIDQPHLSNAHIEPEPGDRTLESQDRASGSDTRGNVIWDTEIKSRMGHSLELPTAADIGFPDLPYLKNYRNPCWHMSASHYPLDTNNAMCKTPECRGYFYKTKKLAEKAGDGLLLRCLPGFFLIGPQKCGTTDLWDKLHIHPLLDEGFMKEPHYWAWELPKGAPLSQYADLYSQAAEKIANITSSSAATPFHPALTGDGSATTIWHNWEWDVKHPDDPTLPPHRIHALIPQAKIIVILRDPIKRLVSDYLYFVHRNGATVSARYRFEKLARQGVQWLTDCFARHNRSYCMYSHHDGWHHRGGQWTPEVRLRLGLYSEFLEDWLATFPGQVHVELLDDYAADKLPVMNRIYRFLGVGDLPEEGVMTLQNIKEVSNIVSKKSYEGFGEVSNKTIKALHTFYAPFNDKLAKMLNRSVPWNCKYIECFQ